MMFVYHLLLAAFFLPYAGVHSFSPVAVSSHLQRRRQTTTTTTTTTVVSVAGAATANTDANTSGDDVCTIQILISDTGGGHRASANALRDAFDVLYPGQIECDIVDIYTDYGEVWPYNDYVALYKLMAKYPWSWDLFYHTGSTDFGICVNHVALDTFCYDSFKECLNRPSGSTKQRADMVVSVHPLTQDIPLKILSDLDSNGKIKSMDRKDRTTPFATVVTDLGSAHPTWFNSGVDKCFVPSDALNDAAKKRGLTSSQIVQYGLPIRKGFWATDSAHAAAADEGETPANKKSFRKKIQEWASKTGAKGTVSKESLRNELGIEEDLPTVLIVGGGDGMGGIVEISKAIGSKLGQSGTKPTSQMVVVCGNNQEARKSLEESFWEKGVKVYVQGFVNNMDEWMKASDALVTKAGPGTIAEASICGLPCMMFSFLPGQEEGNIPFVEDSGFGKYSGEPPVIAETVSSWLASPEKLESMQKAALDAARPEATLDIARDLAEMVFAAKKEQRAPKDLGVI